MSVEDVRQCSFIAAFRSCHPFEAQEIARKADPPNKEHESRDTFYLDCSQYCSVKGHTPVSGSPPAVLSEPEIRPVSSKANEQHRARCLDGTPPSLDYQKDELRWQTEIPPGFASYGTHQSSFLSPLDWVLVNNFTKEFDECFPTQESNPRLSENEPGCVLHCLPSFIEFNGDKECALKLEKKGCFQIPPASSCYELLSSYTNWIHPLLPMLDLGAIEKAVHVKDSGKQVSLLLFKAVMLAGSVMVEDCAEDIDALCNQTVALLDADIESNPIVTFQSMILLAFCDRQVKDRRDCIYWLDSACEFGERLGDQLDTGLDQSGELKRTRWSLAILDTLISLNRQRLPRCRVSNTEHALSRNNPHDTFLPENDTTSLESKDSHKPTSSFLSCLCSAMAELCVLIELVLETTRCCLSPSNELVDALQLWNRKWLDEFEAVESFTLDVAKIATLKVYRTVLIGHWTLAIVKMHFYNTNFHIKLENTTEWEGKPTIDVAQMMHSTTQYYGELYEENLSRFLPSIAVAAIATTAAVELTHSASSCSETRFRSSHNYYLCWQVLHELRTKYSSTEHATETLVGLADRLKYLMDHSPTEIKAQLDVMNQQ